MKSLSIASLALVLALSGCSSSPSIEEETDSEKQVSDSKNSNYLTAYMTKLLSTYEKDMK
jgi:protein involved in sex pheromone biosynthesis